METILGQLHSALEANARDSRYFHDYSNIVKEIIGDPQGLEKGVLELVQAEIMVFQFVIRRNKLAPMFSWTDENGTLMEEPDITRFSDEQLAYLVERQKNCTDLILKARYSHILWLSRVKKVDYAKDAINSYLKLAPFYRDLDLESASGDYWLRCLDVLRNVLLLSVSIGHMVDEVKQMIVDYAVNYPIQSKACSVVRKDLTELMNEQKKVFQKNDFVGLTDSLEQVFEIVKGDQFHHAVEILDVILVVEQKLGNDLIKWKRLTAELWEKITYQRGLSAAIVTTNFCMKAILAYEEIGDDKKVSELYDYYEELRNSVELHTIPLGIESKELYEFADELSKAVLENESDEIIKFLMWDDKIIPRKSEMIKSAREGENSIFDDVHTSVFDQQGNTNRHYGTDTEKDIEKLIFGYSIWLQHSYQIINSIVIGGIKSRRLTHDIVLRYLIKESWYGQELEIGKRKDRKRPFKWLSIIAPGIVDFFVAMEGLIYSNRLFNIATSYDSLTMKIEGIVRTLAEYRGIHTFTIKRDNLGREVSEEKDIMKLLTEPEIIKFIGDDDIFFLRYVFTEKGGLNLRNKVAHSLLGYDQYSLGHLMLIFFAILRLGRFKLKPKD
jgi:hypothetical protein